MTEIRYQDESAQALRLSLSEGPAHWEDLSLLVRGEAFHGGVGIDAAVIGSSHLLEVRTVGFTVTETLACRSSATGRPLASWRPGEPTVECALPDATRYRFEARLVDSREANAETDRLRALIGSAAAGLAEVGLAYRFPAAAGGAGAETLVWAAVDPSGVTARTAHAYPSEGLVMLSETRIALAAATAQRVDEGLPALAAL